MVLFFSCEVNKNKESRNTDLKEICDMLTHLMEQDDMKQLQI